MPKLMGVTKICTPMPPKTAKPILILFQLYHLPAWTWVACSSNTAFQWKDAILCCCISPVSEEALVRWDWKVKLLLIAYFLSNIYAENYLNQFIYVRVVERLSNDTFLRHNVYNKNNTRLVAFFPGLLGYASTTKVNHSGFQWWQRASAVTCASQLHLTPDRQSCQCTISRCFCSQMHFLMPNQLVHRSQWQVFNRANFLTIYKL